MPLPVEPWSRIVRLDQPGRGPVEFALEPEAEARAALAERLGIDALRKLRFTGMLTPRGADWHLEATLGATAVQPCVVTLAPVTTRIDEEVVRRYLDDVPPLPPGDEIEMPQDETVEPRPAALDLGAVMAEALAGVKVRVPLVPLIANVTASMVTDPAAIRDLLVRQVTGTVRWRESVLHMKAYGVVELVELGAGKVLSGLARHIDKGLKAVSLGTPTDVDGFVASLA